MGNEQGKLQGVPTPAGIQSMDESLQKKFSKGIQYNMKIVVRGDRNTGKTTLFHRMEGKSFSEAYIPTNEIQVTSILWSYRVTNDTVKVEIWDVVDKGRSQKGRGSKGLLKMFNSPDVEEEEEGEGKTLDASFLDVYKGAHGVVFTFDITKQWTWKYVERELPKVPLHIPVIVLANFMDLNEHRLISREDCAALVYSLDRPEGAADVRYAECSMKNGFGLMHLHKFLSVPFLQLQQETLLQQLQVNREQTLVAMEELDAARSSEDQNYPMYLAKLQRLAEERRLRSRQKMQDSVEEGVVSPVRRDTLERTTSSSTPPVSRANTADSANSSPLPPQMGKPKPNPQPPQKTSSFSAKFSSKFSGLLGKSKEEGKEVEPMVEDGGQKPRTPVQSSRNIEEFVPEGSVDDFLEDGEEEKEEEDGGKEEEDSDEDSDTGNPLIAADEDLSTPDEIEVTPPAPRHGSNKKKYGVMDFSSDSEEEPPAMLKPFQVPLAQKPSPKPKAPTKPLKSALDIDLTDSEEEEDEEQVEESSTSVGKKPKDKQQSNGKPLKHLEDIFEPSPQEQRKKESKGLMLQFSSTAPSSASHKPSKVSKEEALPAAKVSTPTEESPDQRRREKKKKSKKKRHEEDGVSGTMKSSVSAATSAVPTSGNAGGALEGDPYGAIASLDAWLNSDSNAMEDIVVPRRPSISGAGEEGVEEGQEVGAKSSSRDAERAGKKSKKHKHKKQHHGEREEDGDTSSHKKKHRSKSSRHRSNEQTEDYQFI